MQSLWTTKAVRKRSCIFLLFVFFCFFWFYRFLFGIEGRKSCPFFVLFCSVFFCFFWLSAFCGKLRPCTFMVIAESRKLVRFCFGFLAFCLLWKATIMYFLGHRWKQKISKTRNIWYFWLNQKKWHEPMSRQVTLQGIIIYQKRFCFRCPRLEQLDTPVDNPQRTFCHQSENHSNTLILQTSKIR